MSERLDRPTYRVGVDLHVFDGKFQGSRSHLLGLYGTLTGLCPEIRFYFFAADVRGLRSYAGFDLPNVECVESARSSSYKRLGIDLPAATLRHRLDLLHTQYVLPVYARSLRAVTIHDVLFESHPQYFSRAFVLRSRLLVRRAAQRADLVFTVSDYSKREIAQRYGVSPSRITVVPNAVGETGVTASGTGSDYLGGLGLVPGQYILAVGRIEPRKGYVNLLRAYSKLPESTPPLVIVGQRDFGYGEFDTELARLHGHRDVRVLSSVGDQDLPHLYRNARLFVYPSFAEGFGMPPLEAMSSGVPVISSDSTAITEVVGSAGCLVPPGEPDRLAEAIRSLSEDEALRHAFREKGLARAALYAWTNSAHAAAAALRGALSAQADKTRGANLRQRD